MTSSGRSIDGRKLKKVFGCLLNAVVDRMIFSSVGRRYQIRCAATENALSPIDRLARLTMRLLLLDDRNDGRDGSL